MFKFAEFEYSLKLFLLNTYWLSFLSCLSFSTWFPIFNHFLFESIFFFTFFKTGNLIFFQLSGIDFFNNIKNDLTYFCVLNIKSNATLVQKYQLKNSHLLHLWTSSLCLLQPHTLVCHFFVVLHSFALSLCIFYFRANIFPRESIEKIIFNLVFRHKSLNLN